VKGRSGNFSLLLAAFGSALLLFVAALSAGQTAQSQATQPDVPRDYAAPPGPTQPIPYSHKFHLSMGLQCLDCHGTGNAQSPVALPPTSKCMQCHATTGTKSPSIQKLADYDKSGKPVPWVRVYKVLPGTSFTHKEHLDVGVKCETCHGQVAQMEVMAQVTSVTSMGGCISCHQMHKAPTTCVTCHAFGPAYDTQQTEHNTIPSK
jgi:hypothetical protein